jgi:hypothetical protein
MFFRNSIRNKKHTIPRNTKPIAMSETDDTYPKAIPTASTIALLPND